MAADSYYNPSSRPQPQHYQSYGQQFDSTPAPPYSSLPPRAQASSPISPFEAPFDDHVYPMRPQDSQQSFGQDSTYYRPGGRDEPPLSSTTSFRDDIPLTDHVPKHNMDTDHVYDARESGVPAGAGSRESSKRGFGFFKVPKGKIPWVVYGFTITQVAVFIAEIVRNANLTGSPIEIKPVFNFLIGPSIPVLINMGARYVACMHNVTGVQNGTSSITLWQCPNSTTNDGNDPMNHCTLSELCGFGGVQNPGAPNPTGAEPNQWFRFITPIFLHGGLIHIAFNMLLQITLGREMEKLIGSIRFFLVYVSSGIFGFILGGNYAATGIASTGASGALFGIIALTLLDLLYNWSTVRRPWVELAWILLEIAISFVLGLLPYLDNFSHIGGFLMGLALGICILHSPATLRRRIGQDEPPYSQVNTKPMNSGIVKFAKAPIGFFKGRKPLWWAWWLIRAIALAAVFICFILLLNNFYIYRASCDWCRYLSCLPINGWCNLGNIATTTVTTTPKRGVFDSWGTMEEFH